MCNLYSNYNTKGACINLLVYILKVLVIILGLSRNFKLDILLCLKYLNVHNYYCCLVVKSRVKMRLLESNVKHWSGRNKTVLPFSTICCTLLIKSQVYQQAQRYFSLQTSKSVNEWYELVINWQGTSSLANKHCLTRICWITVSLKYSQILQWCFRVLNMNNNSSCIHMMIGSNWTETPLSGTESWLGNFTIQVDYW